MSTLAEKIDWGKLDWEKLDWEKQGGLIPAIVQDATTGRVLMLGYMNKEALSKTLSSGDVTFHSRSRSVLWTKGETSGNRLKLVSICADCDNDTLLVTAEAAGPSCHKGTTSCFDSTNSSTTFGFLGELERTIDQRIEQGSDESYTARLVGQGASRVAQKVGEEAVELAIAAATNDAAEVKTESADLLYHLLVLLRNHGWSLEDVAKELKSRQIAS